MTLPTMPPRRSLQEESKREARARSLSRHLRSGSREVISTATDPSQHPTSTCPKTAAFYPCPQNMSIAWTYRPPSVHFLAEFGHVYERGRCAIPNLETSPLKRLETSDNSRTPTIIPVPMPLCGRYHSRNKPGGPLSQDTHTSSGLSIYGLGGGT